MKYIICNFLCFILISCFVKKPENNKTISQRQEQLEKTTENLSKEEIDIVNDFLDVELASDRYKNYKNFEIVLIEESGNKIENLTVYEYAYKDWHSFGTVATGDDNQRLGWILDTLQIKELKEKSINKEEYKWKSSDIRNYKVTIMKNESFKKYINSGEYVNLPEKLILRLSIPLIIDKNNAFIGFSLNNSRSGNSINHYTVLMKKTNEKWIIGPSYWDGVMD